MERKRTKEIKASKVVDIIICTPPVNVINRICPTCETPLHSLTYAVICVDCGLTFCCVGCFDFDHECKQED